ncbi:hypothetical protein GWG54_18520 [Natronococcus sp. JC468]|nr:hypothetical protein [Natronococcus sp. JC468]
MKCFNSRKGSQRMLPGQDPSEIAQNLSNKPHRILIAIRTRGGVVPKARITEDTGLESNLINHHLQNLMDAGLVERVDDTPPDEVSREGYTYQITDRGEEVLTAAQEDYNLTPIEQGEVRRRFDDIEERTSDIEARISGLADANQLRSEEIADLQERVDELEELTENMKHNLEYIQEQWVEKFE